MAFRHTSEAPCMLFHLARNKAKSRRSARGEAGPVAVIVLGIAVLVDGVHGVICVLYRHI